MKNDKKIKVLRLLNGGGEGEVIEIGNDLESCYKAIGCDLVDIVDRPMFYDENNKPVYLTIVCDDCGLFKGGNATTIIGFDCEEDENGNKSNIKCVEQIVGNVIIARTNSKGRLSSLEESDIEKLTKQERKFLLNPRFGVLAPLPYYYKTIKGEKECHPLQLS